MANKIDDKVEGLGYQWTAEVKKLKELQAKLRKPTTDAEAKSINAQINTSEVKISKLFKDYTKYKKAATTAKEYVKLNEELKVIQDSITNATARGEDLAPYKQKQTAKTQRLNQISSEVESLFPEVKTKAPSTSPVKTLVGSSGPSGTSTVTTPAKPVVTPAKPVATPVKPVVTPTKPVATPVDRETEALNAAATAADLTLSQTLFKNVDSLKAILKNYVNTPGMPTEALLKEIRNDPWYKQNSKEIKARYVQYYNYRDLQDSGRAQGTTDYEMEIAKIEASLKKRAVVLGSSAGSDPAALRKAAENLYITNRSEDESFITDFLAASVGTTSGMIGGRVTEGYSGDALANYDKIVEAARDNGFQVSDILPGGVNEQQVLQGIASGKIDINRVIADARKLASQGQPTYVRDLLAQGYTLKQVFAPYRTIMANVLEIGSGEQIDLNDPLLRSAITEKGDMNVYDFKKALRKDSRWQYTDQAREDVSSAALGVLRDFGFQG